MKNKAAPWERIKRKQSRMPAVYREKKQSKHIFMIIGVSLSITLLLSFLRIPERIGMINNPMVGATVACAVAVEEASK